MTSSFGANVAGNANDAQTGVMNAIERPSPGSVIGAATAVAGAAVGVASAIGSLIPATLTCVKPLKVAGIVPFDFNPKEITLTRSLKSLTRASGGAAPAQPTGSTGPIMVKSDPPDITMNELYFEGITTKWRCDTLLRWMSPTNTIAAQTAAAMGYAIASQPPELLFVWGPPKVGFVYTVRLTKVTVTYVRFNPTGIPVRAKVSLNMQQVPSPLADLPTNPTSGGIAGRRTHVVRSGDSLQSIATEYYGKPGYWRPIAAINRIIDPLRVRPGTTVYLPNLAELS